ncbi:MAG TPA: hypothetical protein VK929_09445 [Longimicrobiales bacterium]|nr:hypothetical protein [Longimicrobiales bacterium]
MSAHRRPVALSLCCAAALVTACATAPAPASQAPAAPPPATTANPAQAPGVTQPQSAPTGAVPGAPAGRLEYDRPAQGRLTESAPVADEFPYNDWVFTGSAGERVVIELRSRDFDTFAMVGVMHDGEFVDHAMNDDGYADTFDSRIVLPILEAREYVVRVQSLDGDEFGAYSLLLTRSALPAVRPLTPGTTIEGRFDLESPSFSDGEYYELWSFQARPGQRYTVDLRSDDFDTFLSLGLWADGNFQDLADDDDGGDGTNSLIRDWEPPQSGTYVILVESYDGGEGRYTLRVTSGER